MKEQRNAFRSVGKALKRPDAYAKVTGKANYTGDIPVRGLLHAKVLRSTVAHGYVEHLDVSKAKEMPGVVAVFTPDDVPRVKFPTAGHPHCLDEGHDNGSDRNILTKHVRYYGDEVAAVVAIDELTARKALDLIKVEYKELPVYLTPEESLKEGAVEIHEGDGNIVGAHDFTFGDTSLEDAFEQSDHVFEDEFQIRAVQHAHMENHVAYAYKDERQRLVVVTSTQIPHICRRILSQALEMPIGKIRVIKPYVGGGFGAKQDVCVEPLTAFLSMAVGGRPVMVNLDREECMISTRVRHAYKMKLKTGVDKEGNILAKELITVGNSGAYASHGHAVTANQGDVFYKNYPAALATRFEAKTVRTNLPVSGAMRAYGIPQLTFSVESHMDNIAQELGMDPLELREKNIRREGFIDPLTDMEFDTCGLAECLDRAKEYIKWEEKTKLYKNQTGMVRRGVGIATFCYASGTWPFNLEVGGARMTLNQDGSLYLQMGATEIGQGAEAVFSQMAAEASGLPYDKVYMEPINDTDSSPFDTGAYASRQSYVSGQAVKQAGIQIKEKILERAFLSLGKSIKEIDVIDGEIVEIASGKIISNHEDMAMCSYYNMDEACVISSEARAKVETNALSFGATAVELEVDMLNGKVEILKICNVHDCGTVLNPILATGQVHGGMSMSLGMALSEVLQFNDKGKPLNNNLLDYKLPTVMDTPNLDVDFVETYDATGPFGNKSLGEPPAISPAPAVRNAILAATGVRCNETPMNPQSLFERFSEEGCYQGE
jgi:xanthine dehydrogenase molybdenum-binding subunit